MNIRQPSIKIKRIVIAAIILLGAIGLYVINPSECQFAPKCPFKLLTGLSCPGCGIQRAIHALLHGDLSDAISYNLYLVYAGPYAGLLIVQDFFLSPKLKEKWIKVLEHKLLVRFYVYSFIIWLFLRNFLNI